MRRNAGYFTLSQLFLKRNNMGYFTSLVKKHLSIKNIVPDVPFVSESFNPLKQGGYRGTKDTKEKEEECYNFVPPDSREEKGYREVGTKEQTAQEFSSNYSYKPYVSFSYIVNKLTENERYALEERAAIKEYDGGMSRALAEKETITEKINTLIIN